MKKAIACRLCIVILLSMVVTIFLSYYLQIKSAKENMFANSLIRIEQIEQILHKNDSDIKRLKEDLKEDYFIRAKAAAYIIQNRPEIIGNLAELQKVASLLQVDELHLFDAEGTLFDGTEPNYFNFTFNSGEQMQFFLPMLEDNSLMLCQDVTPNTAENKLMQYIAVWREDRLGIVQIGMEPLRILEAMGKNELSYIFNMQTIEKGSTTFALNLQTNSIVGATNDSLLGVKAADIGLNLDTVNLATEGFSTEIKIDGAKNYCVLKKVGNVLVGISSTYDHLYHSVNRNMSLVIFSLGILSVVIIFIMIRMLDRLIINGIHAVSNSMKKIAGGDLDARVDVTSAPEFVELSKNINHMVNCLLEITGKLTLVFQNVDIPIAVYEYNQDMKRVLATGKIREVLLLSEDEISTALSDREIFSKKIEEIFSHPFEGEKDIYFLHDNKNRFVKIKSFQEDNKTLGIIVDVTEEVLEKLQLELERDVDFLTGLSSRRALFYKMDELSMQPEILKHAVLLIADLDNLKYVNDSWGHEYGDRILIKAADLLKSCEAPQKMAARLSGDEFVLMIYGEDTIDTIQNYIDNLYARMLDSTIILPNQEVLPLRLSAGYVFYPEILLSLRELLGLADRALYQVKKNDKSRFKKYEI